MTDAQLAVIIDSYREMLVSLMDKAMRIDDEKQRAHYLLAEVERVGTIMNRAQIVLSSDKGTYYTAK